MSRLTAVLLAIGLIGVALFYLLWGTTRLWNWKAVAQLPPEEIARRAPFWVGLLSLLSVASIVFAVHAFLVVHGVSR